MASKNPYQGVARETITQAAVVWLFMDRFGAHGWMWGVYWTVSVLMVVAAFSLVLGWEWKHPSKEPGSG